MRPMKLMLALGLLTVVMGGATVASAAQVCLATTDCPHGFVCEKYSNTSPPPADAPRMRPARTWA
jgi:hypothetical protein